MTSLSFQIPDLLALTSAFPFRINKHCKLATDWSEGWLLNHAGSTASEEGNETVYVHLQETERTSLRGAKYGLLASLTSPTPDAPQLKVLTDFLSLVFISHVRILNQTMDHGWGEWRSGDDVPLEVDALEVLARNELLKGIVPQIKRVRERLPNSLYWTRWDRRFAHSVRVFAKAQLELHQSLANGTVPTLSEYLALRKEIYASSMFIDLLDLLEITNRPADLTAKDRALLDQHIAWSSHIVSWILDIFSYASGTTGPTRCNSHNLIALLTKHKSLSVQGAMNFCGGMIKEALEELHRLECALLGSPTDAGASWGWFSLGGLVKSAVGYYPSEHNFNQHPRPHWKFLLDVPLDSVGTGGQGVGCTPTTDQTPLSPEQTAQRNAQIARHITAMKDWIVGTIHWGYETELYFGQKGDEVRSFGWVFLSHNDHNTSTDPAR